MASCARRIYIWRLAGHFVAFSPGLLCAGCFSAGNRSSRRIGKRHGETVCPLLCLYVAKWGEESKASPASPVTNGRMDSTWVLSAMDMASLNFGTLSAAVLDTPIGHRIFWVFTNPFYKELTWH